MKRSGLAVALVLGAIVFVNKSDRLAKRRAQRDTIQASAEAAERSGHPWAGVYLSRFDSGVGDTLCVEPGGAYAGIISKSWGERLGTGFGRVSADRDRLVLVQGSLVGVDPSNRFNGAYRIVRWGDIRCLIKPQETARFVYCLARRNECEDFRPFCTRGYVYGEPAMPDELARARRVDPMYRLIAVRSVTGPRRREWGWSWSVELGAGRDEALDVDTRFYWDGSEEWINIQKVGEHAAIGEVQQDNKEGPEMKIPLRAGMKVARWKPIGSGRPDFIYPMADMKR